MIGVMMRSHVVARLVVVLIVTLVFLAAGGGSAFAVQPWWHLVAGERPSMIPASAKDSVQEIAIEKQAVFVGKVELEGHNRGCLASAFVIEHFRTTAEALCESSELAEDAAQLQIMLQEQLGANVTVAGNLGGEGEVGEGESLIVTGHGRGLAPLKVEVIAGVASTKVLSEGGSGRIVLQAFNLGDGPTSGPVVLSDKLPAGLVAGGLAGTTEGTSFPEEGKDDSMTCSLQSVSCTFTGVLRPYERLEIVVWVTRTNTAKPSEVNEAEVSGGGASTASVGQPVILGEGPVPFGVESFSIQPEEEGGAPTTQAGAHPFQLTTTLRLNETDQVPFQPAQPRNLTVALPSGLIGNASATPRCSYAAFATREGSVNGCSADATVGVADVAIVTFQPPKSGFGEGSVPVFNLTPAAGEPARFGFIAGGVPVVFDAHVRAGGDYGVSVTVQNLPESAASLSSVVTLWGVPGDPVHDRSRGFACFEGELEREGCGPSSVGSQKPLLTLPSSCQAPLQSSLVLQSWLPGATPLPPFPSAYEGVVDGCNRESFTPELQVQSSTSSAYSPTELQVHLKVPQQTSEVPGGVSEADVRNTTVTLPAGLQVNPATAAHRKACSEAEIGYRENHEGQLLFAEESQAERYGEEPHRYGCPDGSKIGIVRVKTPLLEEELTGAVYQAAQEANPFGSLLALYIVAEAPKAGVRVRLAGRVQVEPDGQIVSSFNDTPQLPFEEFELKFFGGPKAPLATTGCGTYQTTSVIESWAGGAPVGPFSSFPITSGPEGGACSRPGFAPGFVAGTTNNDAGAFSPFITTLTRRDGEQTFSTVSLTMPRGLLGMLSKVTLCHEPQASAGDCSAASKIGHVRVAAGVGGEPVVLPQAGRPEDPVYITGPYRGAPFGLSIVVPAEAGPFNLDEGGRPVIVRAKIEVNPHTSQITIISDPMPQRLRNIALDVRAIEVLVDRPRFTFNPTDCQASSVTGSIGSGEGATAPVKSRFQAVNCATLPFKPRFKAFTRAHHTRRGGAYLQVVVKSGAGQANIGRVHVTLPKVLPSRLATLKQACSEAQFAKNPAGCPAGSFVGTARARTPVLPVPVAGPAIFVSHGAAAFPNLDIVLQGDGVTVDLVGDTFISKGVTTSTFASVPDVPVERFELTLPEGPHSALSANGDLCRSRPRMPTVITGQNGAQIEQDTRINVRGCGKARRASHRHSRHHG